MVEQLIEDLNARDLEPWAQRTVINALDRLEREQRMNEVMKIRYHMVRERILNMLDVFPSTD